MVQEEGSLLGAKGWAQLNPVETFIALDSSPGPRGSQLRLGGRFATWSKDAGAHFHQPLIGELAQAAIRANSHGYEVSRLSVFDHLVNTLFAYVEELA